MKPETLHRVTVRDVAAALESMDAMEMVQHHVNRLEVRRYLALTDKGSASWRVKIAHSETAHGRRIFLKCQAKV